jgi:N-glycosylase/DNA lyase
MNAAMTHWVEEAVCAVCLLPESEWDPLSPVLDEDALWRELAICILGSQVPNTISVAAAEALAIRQLLNPSRGVAEAEVRETLLRPLKLGSVYRRYRFPNVKAKQLARAQSTVVDGYGTLAALIFGGQADSTRERLVASIPGIGLKQASLFLRNVGANTHCAVLDTHVLRYMSLVRLLRSQPRSLTSEMYYVLESMFSNYATKLGFDVAHVDRAVWAVMSSPPARTV